MPTTNEHEDTASDPLSEAIRKLREETKEQLADLKRMVRHDYAPIPKTHKYSVTEREVKTMLHTRRYCPVGG